ncbi:uncharacterized protein G2W53_001385 [Senna tora]|uniref:Uncharacterized protein n=1 Tax=Senna tora TaxID=362788 RepID=A0A834XFG4_9FABA|nr:uncharacterized protein G2W53_001385 [Senna tora]
MFLFFSETLANLRKVRERESESEEWRVCYRLITTVAGVFDCVSSLRFCSAFVDSSPPGKHFGKGED